MRFLREASGWAELKSVASRSERRIIIGWLATMVLEVFSGYSQEFGLPIPLDRLALAWTIYYILRSSDYRRDLKFRPSLLHIFMLGCLVWSTGNSIYFGTITDKSAFFAILDRLGVIPMVAFVLAPVVFRTAAARRVCMSTFLLLGAYLGFVSVAQGLGLNQLLLPRYLASTTLGSFSGRAGGPFLEPAANGLTITCCMVVCLAVLVERTFSFELRVTALVVTVLDSAAIVFTLTRSIWIGASLGLLVALLAGKETRRYVLPGVAAVVILAAAVVVLVPGFRATSSSRVNDDRSAYDRLNANSAALRALKVHPITGVGWNSFASKEAEWVRQSDSYPITTTGIAVHNVVLGHMVELGLPGASLWLASVGGVLGAALLRTTSSANGRDWKLALLGYVACFAVVGNLVPLGYALPNLLLWFLPGLVVTPAAAGWVNHPSLTAHVDGVSIAPETVG